MVKCTYCGEVEATEKMLNPNVDEKEAVWNVCKDCKEIIHHQMGLSFGSSMLNSDNKNVRQLGEKICAKANDKFDKIANRTKTPIFGAGIQKNKKDKYDVTSIEFTGKSD